MLVPVSPLSSLLLCMLSTRIPSLKSSRVVDSLQWSTLWDKAKTLEAICQCLSQWKRVGEIWSSVQGEVPAPKGPNHLALLLWCNADQPPGSKALQAQGQWVLALSQPVWKGSWCLAGLGAVLSWAVFSRLCSHTLRHSDSVLCRVFCYIEPFLPQFITVYRQVMLWGDVQRHQLDWGSAEAILGWSNSNVRIGQQ